MNDPTCSKRDAVFATTAARGGDFEFNEQVAEVFDDMLARSVPLYFEQQHMVMELARKFWIEGTRIYDLGCSTATTLVNIARELGPSSQLVGYDNSPAMLERAGKKIADSGMDNRIELRLGDLDGNPQDLDLSNAGVVTTCWTLQFIRPARRERLIRFISDNLVDGALIVTEKVLTKHKTMNNHFIEFYYEYKRRNGYSDGEIHASARPWKMFWFLTARTKTWRCSGKTALPSWSYFSSGITSRAFCA